MPGILLGICLNMILGGLSGLKDSLLGLVLGMTFLIFWMLGMLKAGDVKLYMAVGAIGGWRFCGYTMIFSILIGGVAAACLMVIRKDGREAWFRLKTYMLNLFYTKRFSVYKPESQNAYFSFGCCILAGTAAAIWYMAFC